MCRLCAAARAATHTHTDAMRCWLSKFGMLFRKAAEQTSAQVKHDGFDLSVIEIKKEDLRKVYDYLSINDEMR